MLYKKLQSGGPKVPKHTEAKRRYDMKYAKYINIEIKIHDI